MLTRVSEKIGCCRFSVVICNLNCDLHLYLPVCAARNTVLDQSFATDSIPGLNVYKFKENFLTHSFPLNKSKVSVNLPYPLEDRIIFLLDGLIPIDDTTPHLE